MNAFGIVRSGLEASMMRLTVSASNIANAQSTGAVPGSLGEAGQRAYQPVRAEITPIAQGGVQARLVPVDPAYRLSYDPASRHADARGMVAAPNVNIASELVEQIAARLAFEANLKVIATANDLERRSIQLWG